MIICSKITSNYLVLCLKIVIKSFKENCLVFVSLENTLMKKQNPLIRKKMRWTIIWKNIRLLKILIRCLSEFTSLLVAKYISWIGKGCMSMVSFMKGLTSAKLVCYSMKKMSSVIIIIHFIRNLFKCCHLMLTNSWESVINIHFQKRFSWDVPGKRVKYSRIIRI